MVQEHVQGLLEDMKNEEEDCRSKLKENVSLMQVEYDRLCAQLSVPEEQVLHVVHCP